MNAMPQAFEAQAETLQELALPLPSYWRKRGNADGKHKESDAMEFRFDPNERRLRIRTLVPPGELTPTETYQRLFLATTCLWYSFHSDVDTPKDIK